jgi:hypothetical protein
MYKAFLLPMLVGCLLLCACKPKAKKGMLGEWYQSNNSGEQWLLGEDHMLVRLYPKGIYTRYGANSFSFGKWRINEKGQYIHLIQEQGNGLQKDEYLQFNMLQSRLMQANLFYSMSFHNGQQAGSIYLSGRDNKSKEDPYSIEANTWRLKPTAPESDSAIKRRTVGYLNFLETMYQHALDNEMQTLSNLWYPQPLQMYFGNGVRMAYSNELYSWNECFYDSAQAVKGYQVISGEFYNIHLKAVDNKFERNLDCVQQLLKHLEK